MLAPKPAAMVLVSPVTLPITKLVPSMLLLAAIDKLDNDPTLVMFGCAAVDIVPTSAAPLLPIVAALIVVPVTVPLKVKLVRVPTAVMLACVACVTYSAVPADTAVLAVEVIPVSWLPLPIK